MNPEIPELLVRTDFYSPILYKIYTYLRIIHRNGSVNKSIREYFTNNDLMTIIDTLQNCPDNTEFIDKFKSGTCEDVSKRNRNNMLNRTQREFSSSAFKATTNPIIKSIYPTQPINGEIDVLECLFYNYASTVFNPIDNTELGYDGQGVYPSFKRKELQLEEMNKLFCNMGNKINNSRNEAINTALDKSFKRTENNGNVVRESLPKQLISDYLGGKKKVRKHKYTHKRKKTNKKKHRKSLRR